MSLVNKILQEATGSRDLTTFVRYGGLDLKNQDGFGKDTYHSPPTTRGVYAMPIAAQELFLTGDISTTQPDNFPKTRLGSYPDDNATPEELEAWKAKRDAIDWEKHHADVEKVRSNIYRKFRKTDGNVWHHLVDHTPNNEVIARNGTWVKSSLAAWRKAFSKQNINDRYGSGQYSHKSINSEKKTGMYSKDHYEVFFDEKI